eukprot:CAMPEP_0173407638 /NCGR_PEP_ID=MMETSP1356-20130122/67721_1 /TAXON_ID=77927 ORGANISM="Hemiselmis virescens, Strain PCC157" /NCGR_SAMPLE_ID=MMETSP1356 /ASSEMBLY_ACC=CAM_ASM_000847 /LENGTH=157 /DNA_ID=CAMNT_0014368847 /DNA_START=67 /DNA_END=537 /DNA_ORIENTATION=-
MALAGGGGESEAMSLLRDGIKAVGVGVKGSKPIPADLVEPLTAIITGLSTGELKPEWAAEEDLLRQRAASFLGTLFVKVSLLETDDKLLAAIAALHPDLASQGLVRGGCSSQQLLAAAVGERGSEVLRLLAYKMLDGNRLSTQEAYALGRCIFDKTE